MAGKKISEYAAISSSALTDLVIAVQGGVNYKTTLQQIATLYESSLTTLSGLTGDVTAPTSITGDTSMAVRTGTTAADVVILQAYDTGGASYTTLGTLTANNPPTFALTPENISFAATNTGLKFPATQSAVADVNTLDDYEEGSITPTISAGFTTPTYSTQEGAYVKIGKNVSFSLKIVVSGGTQNGTLVEISGLPYAAEATIEHGGVVTRSSGVVSGPTVPNPCVIVTAGASTLNLLHTDGANFVGTDFNTATPTLALTGFYVAAN